MRSEVLLIIPAYNEEASIVDVVDSVVSRYSEYDYVVVNDGSRDQTKELCCKRGYRMIDYPVNLGLAGAFQGGIKYAAIKGYDYAIQIDADGQHNPRYIANLLDSAKRGQYDIIVGSRFVNEKKPWTPRMLGSRLIAACIRLTTQMKISDPTSGMRLYNRRMIEILANQINYGPEPDTLAFLIRCGARVGEVQVFMEERMAGESYLTFAKSIKYMVRMCMSILVVQWFRKKV